MKAARPVKGCRIPDGEWFDGPREAGDYGRVWVRFEGWRWFNRPPNAEPGDPDCVLNRRHVVEHHEDGTVTVHASIANRVYASQSIGGGPIGGALRAWHGYLERGVWREAWHRGEHEA